ncbi:apolipoprotein A-IV b, tandem duplicate 2 isoform X1 [Danio rerio]|uniref:Apolipoprotein A-IV b, tandem duplicate 2 isoform X1 n=3 Tax=Danio rerio TaxID=7955 RepID=A0AC58HH79_DANRE|nr:apolipoprotein A-IV-like isoform X1 [Danio rerio]|eukprot:XP_021322407.1 apolipoprotein A-IV-like isoform X1 [Danio rerio]
MMWISDSTALPTGLWVSTTAVTSPCYINIDWNYSPSHLFLNRTASIKAKQHRLAASVNIMKVLVVFALAVFTGCQANLFYADEPKPQLEQLTDAFWSYVSKATQTAEETVKMIRESQLGQEVNERLTQSADMASEYAVVLKKQVDPLTEELMNKITKETEVLRERLGQDLINVREKLEPYADNMKSQIQQRVEELRAAMAPYADSLDSETLKATLLQKSEELRGNLEQSVKELQVQLEPYTAELKEKVDQHLQEFQKTVTPLTEDLQVQIRERAQMVQQSLTPYAEDLKEKLDPYAQNLKDQLASLYESYTKRN